jgi:hypothetical protein
MLFWILLWKMLLIVGLLLFAVMAIWVTIGGYGDIKKLFEKIRQSHSRQGKNKID